MMGICTDLSLITIRWSGQVELLQSRDFMNAHMMHSVQSTLSMRSMLTLGGSGGMQKILKIYTF